MCDFSGRLIAWMDREVPGGKAADVERHLEACAECRSRLGAYQQASSAFDAYCDAAIVSKGGAKGVPRSASPIVSKMPRRRPGWVPMASGTAAVAAGVVLLVALPRGRVKPPPAHSPETHSSTFDSPATHPLAAAARPVAMAEATHPPMNPIRTGRHRYAVAPVETETGNAAPALIQNVSSLPAEPAIQIAVPAEAMFPPGAVPEGVNFIADLTIAADGSEQVGLRPRLARFERRTTQP